MRLFERSEYLPLLLALSPAVGLGIGRFAYALVLPEMRGDLGWSYGEAGWINSVNAAGYLAGALLASVAARHITLPRLVVGSTLIVAVSTLCLGLTRSFEWLSVWRFAAGLFGAFAFVLGGAIAAEMAGHDSRHGSLKLGFFYGGSGLGIALSGVLAPTLIQWQGPTAWPLVWLVLGAVSILLALATLPVLTHRDDAGPAGGTAEAVPARMKVSAALPLLLGYGAFGAGYIGYMTFMIAWMRTSGASASMVMLFWLCIGAAVLASPWLWARLLRSAPGGRAFSVLIAICAFGALLPLLSDTRLAIMISGLVFGCAFFSVVASTTAFIRRNVQRSEWARAIGTFTVVFGVGQVVGPVLIGAVSDTSGSLTAGLAWSCGLLLLGFVLSLFQRDLEPAPTRAQRAGEAADS
ncbi:YbfB/YjiJ family MFS transporter [Ectothiorhodospiraceae bacterium WFHF3C12]|nr:YbfB/YjiJ family MFS transporter [Ectothiorhodospiraceae bacterium WFHF3C12]